MTAHFLGIFTALCLGLAQAFPAFQEGCAGDSGGTCSLFGCSSSRNAKCTGGKCMCPPGKCSFKGSCQAPSTCNKQTFGTCSMLGCSSKRGDTVCQNGHCNCAPGNCVADDVCVKSCETDTGGSCSIGSCSSSRNAVCDSGIMGSHRCYCKKGTCAVEGKCEGSVAAMALMADATGFEQGTNIGSALFLDGLPGYNDPALMFGVAFVGAMASLVVVFRRHSLRSVNLDEHAMLG